MSKYNIAASERSQLALAGREINEVPMRRWSAHVRTDLLDSWTVPQLAL